MLAAHNFKVCATFTPSGVPQHVYLILQPLQLFLPYYGIIIPNFLYLPTANSEATPAIGASPLANSTLFMFLNVFVYR